MGILSKKTDVSHIITVGFATCSTASNCKEHPPAPRGFVMDWLSRNEGRAVLHFLQRCFLVYIYPGSLSDEEQLLELMGKSAEMQLSSRQTRGEVALQGREL